MVQWFSLDRNWIVVVVEVVSEVHLAKGALTNFLDQAVLLANQCILNTHVKLLFYSKLKLITYMAESLAASS